MFLSGVQKAPSAFPARPLAGTNEIMAGWPLETCRNDNRGKERVLEMASSHL